MPSNLSCNFNFLTIPKSVFVCLVGWRCISCLAAIVEPYSCISKVLNEGYNNGKQAKFPRIACV